MRVGPVVACVLVLLTCHTASAQPAWIVVTSEASVHTPASTVVLFRDRRHTIETLAMSYIGPSETLAIVVPVPSPLGEDDVRALPLEVIDRIELVSAPRLVERWERDPCSTDTRDGVTGLARVADRAPDEGHIGIGTIGHGFGSGTGNGYGSGVGRSGYGYPGSSDVAHHGETLTRGDYAIEIVSPETPAAIGAWLGEHGYRVPTGLVEAATALDASSFVVARLEAPHVETTDGRARLPPLRIAYEADAFELPFVASEAHDVVVQLFAATRQDVSDGGQRAPTGIELRPGGASAFAGVYAAIVDHLFAARPGAVLTEHAWSASSCEGCAGGEGVRPSDLATLGAVVAFPAGVQRHGARYGGGMGGFRDRHSPVPLVRAGVPRLRVGEGTTARPDVVTRVVRRHLNEVRFCYEQELAQRPDLAGRVETSFIVSATGSVQTASVASTTLNNPRVESCTIAAIRRWTFPAPEGGGVMGVQISFALSAREPDEPTDLDAWVLTRLHARDAAGTAHRWTLVEADPIAGGREREDTDTDEPTRTRFETRFVVRHPWEAALECDDPQRDLWGAPVEGQPPAPVAADRSALPIDEAALSASVGVPLASIGIELRAPEPPPTSAAPPPTTAPPTTVARAAEPPPHVGCGCRAGSSSSARAVVALAILAGGVRRRRRRMAARP
jgi:MYXO-CTERM domain-containing protein